MNSTTTDCLIIAGEKSGEEHAESFLPDLIKRLPDTKFFGVGGEYFRELGVETFYDIKDFSAVGFSEVVGRIPFYLKAEKKLLSEVDKRKCRAAILIDFQGFNLKIAKKLKSRGIRVLYYVAPQAWAWKPHRAKTVGNNIHCLFTIIPFEKKWFSERGTGKIISVAHPLYLKYCNDLDLLPKREYSDIKKKLNLLLLPGSRNSEVKSLLPEYIATAKRLKAEYNVEVRLVKTTSVDQRAYDFYAQDISHFYESDDLSKALKWGHLGLAASGTVTLACALFELPTIVSYKTTLTNWFLYSKIIKHTGRVSLGNIVLEKYVFPELLQDRASSYVLSLFLKKWIENQEHYEQTKAILATTKQMLTGEQLNISDYMAGVINEDS